MKPPLDRASATPSRRTFLKAAGAGALAVAVGGALLTPRQAHAQGAEPSVLEPAQAATLAAAGEALVPGAREAGVAEFVDAQLALPPEETKLIARYFDLPYPYDGFYRGALGAFDALARERHGAPLADLDAAAARELLAPLLSGAPDGWEGPPADLAYLIVRADAIDVVYGTPEGYEMLGIPYMAHIPPQEIW